MARVIHDESRSSTRCSLGADVSLLRRAPQAHYQSERDEQSARGYAWLMLRLSRRRALAYA